MIFIYTSIAIIVFFLYIKLGARYKQLEWFYHRTSNKYIPRNTTDIFGVLVVMAFAAMLWPLTLTLLLVIYYTKKLISKETK